MIGYIGIIVCLPVVSRQHNFSLLDEPALHTVVVYDMRICMEEDNPCFKYYKGDNL